jgi:hypothetical protein
MRLAGLLLLLASCTDFDDVTRNTCGNGLLEAGEDCDSSDPSCVRCAVLCDTVASCPSEDYSCGVDGFCHAPSGDLARPTAPVTFQVDDMRVADIDHDGRGDVVGVSRTSIALRYGDAVGALSAAESFVTPAQSGPASFGDIDGDGSLDITLATTEGLVSYTSGFGSLSPVDVKAPLVENGSTIDILSIHAFGPLQFAAFGIADGFLILIVFDFADPNPAQQPTAVVPCSTRLGAIPRAQFTLDKVDLFRAHADTAAAKNAVISFSTTQGATCAMSIAGSTAAGYTVTDITPANTGALMKRPVLIDLDTDSDPCPGLLSSEGGPAQMKWWDGRMVSGRCSLDATVTNLPAMPGGQPGAVAIGRVPMKPAILFVSSDAIVMTNGVYALGGGQMISLYQSSRPLAHVAFGDLDGDGDIDGAAISETEDDIDILQRYPDGVELLRYDTAARLTNITVGDFDGNGVGDLAYSEAAINHQKLYIAYGTNDRHLDPLQVATFSSVASVGLFQFRDSADNLSVADDLIVIQPAAANMPGAVTLLHGSPQRTMLSFLDPRADAEKQTTLFRATVVGNFAGDARADLLGFATNATGQIRSYEAAGTDAGLSTAEAAGTVVDGLGDCVLGGTGACVDARYLAWPRAGGDVVIAVDRRATPRAMRIDPGHPAQAIPALTDNLPAGAAIQSLYAYDIDNDGKLELVAAFTGSVRICDVSADGMPTKCDDVKTAIPSTTQSCVDAAPGRIGARGLVVLCREGMASTLFRVTRTGATLAATELAQGVGLRSLKVADVTGDGVDDVVAVQGDGSTSALVVYPQCTTRDVQCRSSANDKDGGQ